MASLAGMLKAEGFHVTGSDAAAYPPMSDFLASLGIAVSQPFSESHLAQKPDLVVVGNAISRGNVELEYVLDQRIPFESMARVVHEHFLKTRDVLAVAGTHGKTTTTSMLSWIFSSAGRNPSFLIGGIAENFGSSFSVAGPEFIIEADEYDTAFFDKGPKFLHYFPDSVILTSVEFDHADIYKDLDAVKTAFKRLVNLIPRRGLLVAWDNNANVDECIARAFCKVERYGLHESSAWRIVNARYEPAHTEWTLQYNGQHFADLQFALAGEYNVLNATAAAAMASHYGITAAQIQKALSTFKSVKRRLEVKAEVNGITIIDDFAHHPTAIEQTLKALRTRYPRRRLWAILEPRSNTLRRNVFEHDLVRSLSVADQVILAGIFKSEAIPQGERLDVSAVTAALNKSGKPAREFPGADEIVAAVARELKNGDVVAILSNGGFGGIYTKLPERLQSLAGAASR
jgi:UDP-N-acetylmuramate: L-alanyl-gamma-D-glutamyl-meso-diaminopimelate ligase